MYLNFLFMRHGESTANVAGICTGGHTMYELTTRGRTQAAEAAQRLRSRHVRPEIIVHSQQRRAIETAGIVAAALGIGADKMFCNPDWRERGFGHWEGTPFLDVKHHLEAWIDPPEGETFPEIEQRTLRALQALSESQPHPDSRPEPWALVVSHGGLWHVLNKIFGVVQAPHIENAAIFEVAIGHDRHPPIKSAQIA